MYKNPFCSQCSQVIDYFLSDLLEFICISREEWEWLHKNNSESSIEDESLDNSLDLFKTQFRNAAKELFVMLGKIFRKK